MPSCASCVRTCLRTATSTRLVTVCRPVSASRYVTVEMPARIMSLTASRTARSAVVAPVFTFVAAAATAEFHRASAPAPMSTLSRARTSAMPRAVSLACVGMDSAAVPATESPSTARSAASALEMASPTVASTARETSPLCDSTMAMISAERVCASSSSEVAPRWPSDFAPVSMSLQR